MRIDAGMDTGDMLLQEEIDIAPGERAPELTKRMAVCGAALMMETLRRLPDGLVTLKKQNDELATYAPLLKKEDGRIDWNRRAREIVNHMRGFAPWPGAFTTFRGKTSHLWGEALAEEWSAAQPGTLLLKGDSDLHVACGDATVLRVLTVKLEGRTEVPAQEFVHGARLAKEERFGHSQIARR
jgi:methionyl-tRNA formyltransferase